MNFSKDMHKIHLESATDVYRSIFIKVKICKSETLKNILETL